MTLCARCVLMLSTIGDISIVIFDFLFSASIIVFMSQESRNRAFYHQRVAIQPAMTSHAASRRHFRLCFISGFILITKALSMQIHTLRSRPLVHRSLITELNNTLLHIAH